MGSLLSWPIAHMLPGGHRSRVTPVPIPNTEVKPATADGTAAAGLWESRSLPGVILDTRPRRLPDVSGVRVYGAARAARKLGQYAARKVIHLRDVDSTLPAAGGGRTSCS